MSIDPAIVSEVTSRLIAAEPTWAEAFDSVAPPIRDWVVWTYMLGYIDSGLDETDDFLDLIEPALARMRA